MEHPDPQLANRVWQRVQNKPTETPPLDIFPFLQEEFADLSRYLQLQNTLDPRQKGQLQQLIQKTRSCILILRGIGYLLSDTLPETQTYPLPKELPLSSLRRLYGDTLRRCNCYAQWRSDSAYGIAFAQLETESHQRAILLLQLMGNHTDKLLAFFP